MKSYRVYGCAIMVCGLVSQACANGAEPGDGVADAIGLQADGSDADEGLAHSALVATPDLSAAIQGQNSAVPGESIGYNVLIRNQGTANATSFTVTLTATNAASMTVPGASCSTSGPTRTCTFGSGSLMRGYAFRKSAQVVALGSPGSVALTATVTGTNGDANPGNNTHALNVLVAPLPAALSVAPPQTTDNLLCVGSAPLAFTDCIAAPSSYVPSGFTLNADHTVYFGAPSSTYTGVWSQPTPSTLEVVVTNVSTGLPHVVYSGAVYAPKCFRGTVAYPGLSYPWYGAFQWCMTP